jgi:hypothetical protein
MLSDMPELCQHFFNFSPKFIRKRRDRRATTLRASQMWKRDGDESPASGNPGFGRRFVEPGWYGAPGWITRTFQMSWILSEDERTRAPI